MRAGISPTGSGSEPMASSPDAVASIYSDADSLMAEAAMEREAMQK